MTQRKRTVQMGEHVLTFENEPFLDSFFIEKALVELNENENVREKAVDEIRKRINDNEELIIPMTDNTLPLSYLRACKFYIDETYDKIVSSYKFRAKNAQYFADLLNENDNIAFLNNVIHLLPYRDQHGRRIGLAEFGEKWKPKDVSLTELTRGILAIVEIACQEPKTQISGGIIIFDFNGLTINHVWQFTPGFAKFVLDYIQKYLPMRLKAVHIVNQPSIFNILFAIFKPFIGEKLRNRIYFHGEDMSSLTKHIDSKCLPTQYGGTLELKTIYGIEIFNLTRHYQEIIEEINSRQYIKNDKKK